MVVFVFMCVCVCVCVCVSVYIFAPRLEEDFKGLRLLLVVKLAIADS